MATNRKSRKQLRKAHSTAQDRMLAMMHQIWLAGLGALSKARNGAPQLLDELITEGGRVQADTRGAAQEALGDLVGDVRAKINARVNQMRDQAGGAYDNLEKIFQSRVQGALKQLGVPSAEDVDRLGKRVDELNANIAKLARKRGPSGKHRARAVASR
jgi:poly(hydroxyalkanoate) granule-associated protein